MSEKAQAPARGGMAMVRRALDVVSTLALWVAIAAAVLMMLHVCLDTLGRALRWSFTAGTTEIVSAYYMIAIAFLPWAWVTRENSHIAADVFVNLLGPRTRAVIAMAVQVVTIVFVAIFTYQTYLAAVKQTRLGESMLASIYYLSIWPARWVLPLAGALMLLQLLLQLPLIFAETKRRARPAAAL